MFASLFAIPFTQRLAITLWSALILGVCGRVAFSKPDSQTVMPIYLAAGERWNTGEELYAWNTGMDFYRNPPGFAAAFSFLTEVPEKVVAIGWRLLGVGVFFLGVWRFRWVVLPTLSPTRAAVLFSLAAVLILPSVNNGQVNTLIAGSVLNGFAAMGRRNWWQAAMWFTLGGWLKLYPFAAALLACLLAPKSLIPRMMAVAVVAFSLPFLLQNPNRVAAEHVNFVREAMRDDRTWASLDRVPRDWTILSRVWFDAVPQSLTTKGLSILVGIAMAGWLFREARREKRLASSAIAPRLVIAGLVFASVWMTAFGPATESNTYSILAGAAAVTAVVVQTRSARRLAWLGTGLILASIVRAAFPDDWMFTALGPQPLGALLILSAVLIEFPSRFRREPEPNQTPAATA